MLVKTEMQKTPSVERLAKAWAQLYTPASFAFSSSGNHSPHLWVEAASPAGRAATVAKLGERIVEMKCQMASIQTTDLYTYMPNVLDCNELRRLAEISLRLYQQLFELYQQHAPSNTSSLRQLSINAPRSEWAASGWGIPDIEQFADSLEPILLEFQAYHKRSKDWRSIGFLTTQLNFCNYWLLQSLTPPERLFLNPYLSFVEEYVAHPWQRVCAAAVNYGLTSPILALAEQMIPVAEEVSYAVYHQVIKALPHNLSRRGTLEQHGVAHSSLRDIKMFQSFLWLCVLEQSMDSVDKELVPLCLMVFPSIGVKWELIELGIKLVGDEILRRVEPAQQELVSPYTDGMLQSFIKGYLNAPAMPRR